MLLDFSVRTRTGISKLICRCAQHHMFLYIRLGYLLDHVIFWCASCVMLATIRQLVHAEGSDVTTLSFEHVGAWICAAPGIGPLQARHQLSSSTLSIPISDHCKKVESNQIEDLKRKEVGPDIIL